MRSTSILAVSSDKDIEIATEIAVPVPNAGAIPVPASVPVSMPTKATIPAVPELRDDEDSDGPLPELDSGSSIAFDSDDEGSEDEAA